MKGRSRWWLAAAVVLLLLVSGGVVAWRIGTRVRPVTMGGAVTRYRAAVATAGPTSAAGPPRGVYVYATEGSERVSAGGVTHQYPGRTTLTVTGTACGMHLRWDALAQRWMQWDLCVVDGGWRLRAYTDFHEFLYVSDRLDYTCAAPAGDGSVACTTDGSKLDAVGSVVGREALTVDGTATETTHLRITGSGHGRSTATDLVDLWVADSGLPVQVAVNDHGSQERLGATITYDEHASFRLTSTTPLR